MSGQRKRRRGLLDLEQRPHPIPKCPGCFKRVQALCTDAPDGAEPCGFGLACGCCMGPHQPPKPPSGDREER
jgi:hypothetical protein